MTKRPQTESARAQRVESSEEHEESVPHPTYEGEEAQARKYGSKGVWQDPVSKSKAKSTAQADRVAMAATRPKGHTKAKMPNPPVE